MTFANPFDVVANGVPSPKIRPSILEDAPLNVEWPEVYAGKGGVVTNDRNVISSIVLGFPSIDPDRIAVIGRQWW